MARIPYLEPDAWSPQLQDVLSGVPPLRLFAMLAHSSTSHLLLRLGSAQLAGSALPPRLRQLAILTTAKAGSCEYIWIQHEPISDACGVTREQRDALSHGDFAADVFDARDTALLYFVTAIIESPFTDDDIFAAAKEHLSNQEIVEVLQVTGYYWTAARVVTTLDIEPDVTHGMQILDGAARIHGRSSLGAAPLGDGA